MKKKTIRKILSITLALLMVLGTAPGGVTFAASGVEYVADPMTGETDMITEYAAVSSSVSTWGESETTTWYVLDSDVKYSKDTRIEVKGDVNLILANNYTLWAVSGITVQDDDNNPETPSPNSLTIYGQEGNSGSLYIGVADNFDPDDLWDDDFNGVPAEYAGIGGASGGDGGKITINGGTIIAATRTGGAGIGGGGGGNSGGGTYGGKITINGGDVTAIGGDEGAGIGGGYDNDERTISSPGGIITIGGNAVVKAYGAITDFGANRTRSGGAGIGGGREGAGGTITIGGNAVVYATGGEGTQDFSGFNNDPSDNTDYYSGAGIGGGANGDSGDITIKDNAQVTAIGGAGGAAGIGSGNFIKSNRWHTTNTITISGGTVIAKGGSAYIENGNAADKNKEDVDGGAGIGGGYHSKYGGVITISGGNITAQGGLNAAGIGGGSANGNDTGWGDGFDWNESQTARGSGDITITGGIVNAIGGTYETDDDQWKHSGGAAIGAGDIWNRGDTNIVISGGTVIARGVDHRDATSAPPGIGYIMNPVGEFNFSTGESGNATIWTTEFQVDNLDKSSGLIIEEVNTGTDESTSNEIWEYVGKIYPDNGEFTLEEDFIVEGKLNMYNDNVTLEFSDETLVIAEGVKLINNGVITGSGVINNNSGGLYNNGTIGPNIQIIPSDSVIQATPPAIVTQPTNAAVYATDPATFTVEATGEPAPTYQWQCRYKEWVGSTTQYVDWADIIGATGSTYTIKSASMDLYNDKYEYRCIVTNELGTVTSNAVTITVAKKPLGTPTNISWKDGKATWDTVPNAEEYRVYLYDAATEVEVFKSSHNTTGLEYDLSITTPGSYYFGVGCEIWSTNFTNSEIATSEAIDFYGVTWENSDGTVLETEALPASATPVYSGVEPTRAADRDYEYKFAGWNPAVSPISGTTTYTAVYTKTFIAPAAGTGFTVDYTAETAELGAGYEISKDGKTWVAATTAIAPGDTIYVRKAATSDAAASSTVTNTIAARPGAPAPVGTNETVADQSDGKITGVDSTMEYRAAGTEIWTDCTGTEITSLAAGNYEVRIKATGSSFAGEVATVTIATGDAPTYTLNVKAPTFAAINYNGSQPAAGSIIISNSGNSEATITSVAIDNTAAFTIAGGGTTVASGSSINTWTVQPAASLDAGTYTGTITVTYNGGATATATVSFSVNGIDQTPPADALTMVANSQNSITLNTISPSAVGSAVQYSKDGGTTWQDSPVFSGLSAGTSYTFVARYAANEGYYASLPGMPATFSTQSASGGGTPSGGSTSGGGEAVEETTDPAIDTPSDWTNPFTDVAEKHWFYEAVEYVNKNGLMNGTSATLFSPNQPTSRGMIVTILWRVEGEPEAAEANPFGDIKDGQYYYDAVLWAAENEIVNGYGGNFDPNTDITREQLAAILWRYAKYKGYDVSIGEETNILSYSDAFDVSEYAVPAMQWACGEGIVTGKTSGSGNGAMILDPQGDATRAEAAAMLQRFLEDAEK